MSASEISNTLRDDFGIALPWQTIQALLVEKKNLTAQQRRKGRRYFAIMKAGEDLLTGAGQPISLVDPARSVQEVISLHAFLASLKGTARICDPYFDTTTIEHLDACAPGLAIRLLSKKIHDPGGLKQVLAAFNRAGRSLEVRIAAAALHDRYIIDDASMLILGTSLNGFGKSQHFVIKAGADVRAAVLPAFDGLWSPAKPWP